MKLKQESHQNVRSNLKNLEKNIERGNRTNVLKRKLTQLVHLSDTMSKLQVPGIGMDY